MRGRGVLLWVALAAWAGTAAAAEPGRIAAASFPLTERHHGLDGTVTLLADRRITAATVKTLKDFQWFGFGTPPAVEPPVAEQPLVDARLDIVGESGRVVASLALGTPFSALVPASLRPGKGRQFVLETANGGFGQFTGTVGRPFAVEAGRIRFLAATDAASGAEEDIRLLRAPRTDWMILPATDGRPGEILQAGCRPGEGGAAAFAQVLESWRYEGGSWRRRATVSQGYCDWSPGLPPLSAFP